MRRWASLALSLTVVVVMVGAILRIPIFSSLFFVLLIVGLPVMGAYIVVFNRRYTEEVLRQQNALLKRMPGNVRFSERWVPFWRVFAVIVGSVLFVGGLAYADRYLPSVELRGGAAVIFVAILGMVVVGFGGLTFWWLARKPETAAVFEGRRGFIVGSVVLAFAGMIGVLAIGIGMALSE